MLIAEVPSEISNPSHLTTSPTYCIWAFNSILWWSVTVSGSLWHVWSMSVASSGAVRHPSNTPQAPTDALKLPDDAPDDAPGMPQTHSRQLTVVLECLKVSVVFCMCLVLCLGETKKWSGKKTSQKKRKSNGLKKRRTTICHPSERQDFAILPKIYRNTSFHCHLSIYSIMYSVQHWLISIIADCRHYCVWNAINAQQAIRRLY